MWVELLRIDEAIDELIQRALESRWPQQAHLFRDEDAQEIVTLKAEMVAQPLNHT